MTDDVVMLRPLPSSVGVQVHPGNDHDLVSIVMVDAATGRRHLLLTDPDTALYLGDNLVHACTDPEVAAQADRLREQL